MTERKAKSQGMNWISQHKRLAIYMRDGLSCCYCGDSVELGAQLTLDHIKPYSKGGNNHESNLVTCCHKCNSSRGNRPMKAFATAVAKYVNHGITAETIITHVNVCRRRPLDIAAAKQLIAHRGSCAKVLAAK